MALMSSRGRVVALITTDDDTTFDMIPAVPQRITKQKTCAATNGRDSSGSDVEPDGQSSSKSKATRATGQNDNACPQHDTQDNGWASADAGLAATAADTPPPNAKRANTAAGPDATLSSQMQG